MHQTPKALHYTQLDLDRRGEKRRDKDWPAKQMQSPHMRCLLLHDNRNLLSDDSLQAEAVYVDQAKALELMEACDAEPLLLGITGDGGHDCPIVALDVSELDAEPIESSTGGRFGDLRKVGAHIDPVEGSLLGFARGLVYWHATSRHCARCGSVTTSSRGGFSRRCKNPDCDREHFPRNDPAVIMLVEQRPESGVPRCLLGRNKRFINGMFSTLAGFVDVGETLEQAVRREVKEEAGVRTFNERYVASQPWPFPGSFMLGFRAETHDTDISIDDEEIAEARWFTADELNAMREWDEEGDGPCLPRRDSIARHLIDLWLQEQP